jgi:anti-sigma B factor antagonist
MSMTSFCDSAGVRAIVIAHSQARSKGVEMRLVVRSAQVKRLFEITNLDTLLRVYPDPASALADA